MDSKKQKLKQFFMYKSILIFILMSWFSNIVNAQSIKLNTYAGGFTKPVDISNTGTQGDGRLFITEKDGRIRIVEADGTVLSAPFLDIDPVVNSGANERGLLGLCFHPDYSNNGYFYVHYTNSGGHSTISRFKVSQTDPDKADPGSEKVLLVVNQPFNNHNAGDLEFGPDGYLYIGMGDGGNAGDPNNRSQNPQTLLGKMLRIDVNTETEKYLIPADNPYKNNPDTLPEIWALGLRNPWRFCIDTVLNEIWIADVGQDEWEEINVASLSLPALNYGWRCYEGLQKFNFSQCSDNTDFFDPVHVYANKFDVGCSVTGGFVYRGDDMPILKGRYIYADFCTGKFWSLTRNGNGAMENEELADLDNMEFATFGLDVNGEMYVAGLGNGTVFKLESGPSAVNHLTNGDNYVFRVGTNPASGTLDIFYEEYKYGKAQWNIYNLTATPFPVKIIKQSPGAVKIDISLLPPGMYIIKNSENRYWQKFVKH